MVSTFYLTAEVRWFAPGPLPEEIPQSLFSPMKDPPQRESRTDTYVVFPHSTSVGVKFRKGAFEVKSWIRDSLEITVTQGLTGVASIWEKWSGMEHSDNPLTALSSQKDRTMEVAKDRWLYTLAYDGDDLVDNQHMADSQGCQIEVSNIISGRKAYWSYCLEAFGEENVVERILEVAKNHSLIQLPLEASLSPSQIESLEPLSYPEWLSTR